MITGWTDRAGTWARSTLLLSWGVAFALACRLDGSTRPPGVPAPGLMDRMAGSLRAEISARLYIRADKYFHAGGVEQGERGLHSPLDAWRDQIHPRDHRHVEGRDIAEIMPWLRWATEVDGTQVDAFLTAAYWMQRGMGRADQVEAIYREAARRNPHDYRVALDWGRSRARRGEFDRAIRLLGSALRFWPRPLTAEDEQAAMDRTTILEMRGFLRIRLDDRAGAVEDLRLAAAISPRQAAGLLDWVRRMEAGEPVPAMGERIDAILRGTERNFHDGEHAHEDDEAHGHQD